MRILIINHEFPPVGGGAVTACAAMAACLIRQVPITEYSPKKIKMAITGNGNASL